MTTASSGHSARWASVPPVPETRRAWDAIDEMLSTPWGREPVAAILAGIGPTVRAAAIAPAPRWIVVASVTVAASAIISRRAGSMPWLIAAAAGAGTVAAPFAGVFAGLWLAGGLILADWVVRRRPILPGLPAPPSIALLPIAALTATATVVGTGVFRRWEPLAITAAAGVIAALAAAPGLPGGGGRLAGPARLAPRVVAATRRWASAIAGTVLFGILAVVVVVIPWVVTRIARVDPLDAPTRPGSSWTPRLRRDVRSQHPWATDPAELPLPSTRRLRVLAALVVLVLVGILAVPRVDRALYGPEPVPTAFAGDWWWPEYEQAMRDLLDGNIAWNPDRWNRVHDVRSEFINVTGGLRRTWPPPACSCRRLTIWLYGGSTMFGVGQRDDHTIPSELARLGWEEGIALDVVNRGVIGDTHFDETTRFAWDVTAEPPDLVIFYDGVNDLSATQQRNDLGLFPSDEPESLFRERLALDEDKVTPWQRITGVFPDLDDHTLVTLADRRQAPTTDPVAIATRATTDYGRGVAASTAAADAAGVPVLHYWQPTRFTRSRPVDGEPSSPDPSWERWNRELAASARSNLPEGVRDLGGAFDDVRRPVFFDGIHTNEYGAQVIASALLDDIRSMGLGQ